MTNLDSGEFKVHRLTDLLEVDNDNLLLEIIKTLSELDMNLVNKKIEYFFKKSPSSPQQKLAVAFLPKNIMHLFGISAYADNRPIKSGESFTYAIQFYDDFKKDCLNFEKCWVESISKVSEKVSALAHIEELLDKDVRIGGSGSYISLSFSNIIRTNKKILAVAVIGTSQGFCIPLSALNLTNDKRATQDPTIHSVVPCSKLIVYIRQENGEWQLQEQKIFDIKKNVKKGKKNKKHVKN